MCTKMSDFPLCFKNSVILQIIVLRLDFGSIKAQAKIDICFLESIFCEMNSWTENKIDGWMDGVIVEAVASKIRPKSSILWWKEFFISISENH
jgi:hypothetical protein